MELSVILWLPLPDPLYNTLNHTFLLFSLSFPHVFPPFTDLFPRFLDHSLQFLLLHPKVPLHQSVFPLHLVILSLMHGLLRQLHHCYLALDELLMDQSPFLRLRFRKLSHFLLGIRWLVRIWQLWRLRLLNQRLRRGQLLDYYMFVLVRNVLDVTNVL